MRTKLALAGGVLFLWSSQAMGQSECVRIVRVMRMLQGSSGAAANLAGTPLCLHTDSDSDESSALVYDHTISLVSTCNDTRGIAAGFSNTSERSTIAPTLIFAEGSAVGVGDVDHQAFQHASGTGIVDLTIEIEVLLARPFVLSVGLASGIEGLWQPTVASARFSLIGPGINIEREAVVQRSDSNETARVDMSGVLTSGVYTLHAHCGGTGYTIPSFHASGAASYTVNLRIEPAGPRNPRCPQDWNNDGVVNSTDFFEFMEDLFSGDADFNGDCVIDSRDFFDYVGRFFGICD